jgi:hypothetical protein
VYEKRDAEAETLHRVVRENLATFYAAVEEGWVDGGLPEFVRAELAGYLSCSVLQRGFAHLECEDCGAKLRHRRRRTDLWPRPRSPSP